MILQVAWFEIRFWLRSWMLWAFLLIVSLLVVGAIGSDEFRTELGLANVAANAPFAIATFYAASGVVTLLFTTVFLNFAALRDFSYRTSPIVFSTPVRRRDFLLGRFLGAALISVVPTLGVSLGTLAAHYVPGVEPAGAGPVSWSAHWNGILGFAVPDAFLTAAVLFGVAAIWKREAVSFVAVVGFVAVRALAAQLFLSPEQASLRALVDPFGVRSLDLVTRYWTVAERNASAVHLAGALLANRALWIGVGCAALALAYFRFSFAERRARRTVRQSDPSIAIAVEAPGGHVRLASSTRAQLLGSARLHFRGLTRNLPFVVVVLIATLLVVAVLAEGTTLLNNRMFPVTWSVIEQIRGALDVLLAVVVGYFSGALVWKDREERVSDLTDATPAPEWVSYAARLAALVGLVLSIEAVATLAAIADQILRGYYRFQLGLYARELLLRNGSWVVFMAVLAFFVQTLAPNKYVGYVVVLAVLTVNTYLWPALNVGTNLVRFGARPVVVYSDFFGDRSYRTAWSWFTLYWLLFCSLLAIATVMFWPRGRPDRWRDRARHAALRFRPGWRIAAGIGLAAFTACGAWIWFNTAVVNRVVGPRDLRRIQAEYEKTYKPLDRVPQPRVRRVTYAIDLYPASRSVTIAGTEVIANPYSHPLDQIQFSLDPRYRTSIELPGAVLAKDDTRLSVRIYRLTAPLEPGEERTLRFTVTSAARGFENEVSNPQIAANGTFISNLGPLVTGANYLAPVIGYNYWRELTDVAERKQHGLHGLDRMAPPERGCTDQCRDTYLPGHADWVEISAVIGTADDQVAVAPGSLERTWRKDGRRYFEYRLDHPSLDLYCFASARYAVAREEWKGIALEVYYLPEHGWNVPAMLDAMKRSLGYYVAHYGPYPHRQARIVEYPRVAAFAAALPGTMLYSESLGFIADLRHADDLNTVFYVVAHEMAHQWWDGQMIGANLEGATLLSESLAEYSALVVMEKTYGRDRMRQLLRHEMDLYLRGRGQERSRERPLFQVEYRQFYVFYQKGALALYYLKDMIGEDAMNQALGGLIRRFAYAPAPYPTSFALLDALRQVTPANLQYLIKDLFEDITLFSNRTLSATAAARPDGTYDVTIEVEAHKFKADPSGNEAEVPIDDWIDIGAFAKPEPGRKYGRTLYRERVHVTERRATFRFTASEPPEQAGIDPFALLIDRSPDDNVKTVTVAPLARPNPG